MSTSPAPRRALLLRVSPWGGTEIHGGQLRSQQIAGLVEHGLPDAVQFVAPHPRALSRPALMALATRGAREAAAARCRPAEGFYTAWVDSLLAAQKLRAGDLVIYDADPRYGPALVRVAARRRLRVIALPHNIEALIPQHFPIHIDVDHTGRALADEVRWLARTDGVWTIGALDRELFQLFGIAAEALPYAPPPHRAAELLAIRARRAETSPRHLLVLGTAHNPPTRAGMLEQLAMLRALGTDLPPVIVAGYGTDALAGTSNPGATILGSRSWTELQDLMAEAHALWVHQAPMSGALTRIPEALTAGIPVLANTWAARGHGSLAGMQIYTDTRDFAARLAALVTAPASVPIPDASAAEARFIDALRTA